MSKQQVSGVENGQRQLNGPQTSGREYRNLSQPGYTMIRENDVEIPMRDGLHLVADIFRPAEPGVYPVLIAASPYFHVIANLGGTSGSQGVFGFFDSQERRDMYDLVEWAAVQPWSDSNVGMVGISYFAMTL